MIDDEDSKFALATRWGRKDVIANVLSFPASTLHLGHMALLRHSMQQLEHRQIFQSVQSYGQ